MIRALPEQAAVPSSAGVLWFFNTQNTQDALRIASGCFLHGAAHSFSSDVGSRMVLAMTPVCLLGVVLSVQPTFIFGGEGRLNPLGVFIAIGQVPPICVNVGRAFQQFMQTRNGCTGAVHADLQECMCQLARVTILWELD